MQNWKIKELGTVKRKREQLDNREMEEAQGALFLFQSFALAKQV